MKYDAVNSVALVTGSNRGIGAAIAIRLASLGHTVVINCRHDVKAADAVADEIKQTGKLAVVITADVSTPDGARELVDSTAKNLDAPLILVNNVGPYLLKPVLELTT